MLILCSYLVLNCNFKKSNPGFIETKGVDVIVMLLKYTLPENNSKSPWK